MLLVFRILLNIVPTILAVYVVVLTYQNMLLLQISQIIVEGAIYIDNTVIIKQTDINVGQSMIHVSINNIKRSLLSNKWIKKASVYKRFPDKMLIQVVEATPIAVWNADNGIFLVDKNSRILNCAQCDKKTIKTKIQDMLVIVGKDAHIFYPKLRKTVQRFTNVFNNIDTAYLVNTRRWNLIMKNNALIKLSQNIEGCISILESIVQSKLYRHIKMVDLRIEKKIIIKKV